MLKYYCGFFFMLVVTAAVEVKKDIFNSSGIIDNEDTFIEQNLNDLFDEMLPTIRREIIQMGFDPMPMPDTHLTTTKIPGLRGKIHCQNGIVQEVSTVRRTGDIIIQYNKKKLNFDIQLGFDRLDTTYSYTLRYLLYKRKGTFHGAFKNVKLNMYGSVDLTNNQTTLKYFELAHVGAFSLNLEGHLTDILLNLLTKVFTTFSKESIIKDIETKFEESIREKIREFNDSIPEPLVDLITAIQESNESS